MTEKDSSKSEAVVGENREKSTAGTETPTRRVLPADVYDTLELSALAFRGIGAGEVLDSDGTPFCLIGHIQFVHEQIWTNPLWDACTNTLGVSFFEINNRVVRAINARKNKRNPDARVTWKEFTRELNIVRGAA